MFFQPVLNAGDKAAATVVGRIETPGLTVHQPVLFRPAGGLPLKHPFSGQAAAKLDDYLHKHGDTAHAILKKIQESEKERKAISGIKKLARERAKKANLHNKKLRDCRVHYNGKDERKNESTLFLTEGDSASGSITKSRDVNTQAVFSLRGKPLNSFGLTKKVVYEN